MFTVSDLFMILVPGTFVTIEDEKRYLVINEPFDGIDPNVFESILPRRVSLIRAGYCSLRIALCGEEV